MIMENATQALKTLNDLDAEANAVMTDPISKDLTTVSNAKEIIPILTRAKQHGRHLTGILLQIQKASR